MRQQTFLLASLLSCAVAFAQDHPVRPKITGIARVHFYAGNIEASRAFYSNTLGLPSEQGACVKVPRPCFTINPSPSQRVELEQAPSPAPKNLLAEVVFASSNVAQMRRYLLAHGLTVGKISKDANGTQHFELRDPEGNSIAFVQDLITLVDYKVSSAQVSTSIIHAGFVVRDRAATDHFYKDILGFRPYWHGGMKDDTDDWVAMQVPDGTDWVEYMLNIPPDASHHLLGVMNHIALGVPDIQAAKAQLIKNGWKPGEEPKLGRDGKWQLNLYDPDDTRIEFMEFTPKEKPCCSEFTGPHPKP
jgi:catechol 2,3-dioxygenase-like lactoylglutathione lyase family enzyme